MIPLLLITSVLFRNISIKKKFTAYQYTYEISYDNIRLPLEACNLYEQPAAYTRYTLLDVSIQINPLINITYHVQS